MTKQIIKKQARVVSLSLMILREIGEISKGTLDALFPAKYPQTKLWRDLLGLDTASSFTRQVFSSTLNRLKRQGFICAQKTRSNRVTWRLTRMGKTRVHENPIHDTLPGRDGMTRVFTFDIPVAHQRHRYWLRRELLVHDYQMLQKSVWVGDRPFSEEFIKALRFRGLFQHIHVFSVRRNGTIGKKIVN